LTKNFYSKTSISNYCRDFSKSLKVKYLCRGFLLVIAGGEILPALAGLPEIAFEMTPFGDGK